MKKLMLLGGLRYLLPVIEAAHQQGVLRESVYKDGKYKNQIFYALLKSEYKPVIL